MDENTKLKELTNRLTAELKQATQDMNDATSDVDRALCQGHIEAYKSILWWLRDYQ